MAICLALTKAISQASTLEQIYEASLDALERGLAVSRASILSFDPDGIMRFKASRGLSDAYRAAVEGHTPWQPDTADPQPIVIADVTRDPSLVAYRQVIADEGIAAMAFIPLVSQGRVTGKFMLYYEAPRDLSDDELQLAGMIAAQVAFAVCRTRADEAARRSEARLRFTLDAASIATWEWDLDRQMVSWSDNFEPLHGLQPGTVDRTFESYESQIHPDDRARVRAAYQRTIEQQAAYDIEYRVSGPDGAIRWVAAKGRVECVDNKAARMIGVCMLVTPRKEAELARLAVAEDANRLKDDFLGVLSHELRTPLNAVVGWVQMIQQGGTRSVQQVDHAIEVIGRNARLQAQLIEDILDVTRIAAGKFEIERQPVPIALVVDAVLNTLLPTAKAKHIRMVREVSDGLPLVDGDAKRLQQALGNVVANAIKFTPDGGRVTIAGSRVDDSIVLRVRDSGIGIAAEFLPLVFERFQQRDDRSGHRHGGLGLGLAIARHLIEQHGGRISASSEGHGRGSTFSITLPITAAVSRGHGSNPQARPGPVGLAGMTVLVMDDVPDSRELSSAILKRCGAEIIHCDSTPAALDLIGRAPIDLIVADLGLSDVNGLALIERVRASGRRIPAVAVSAPARVGDRIEALKAGYDGYCAKPIEIQEFLQTVAAVLTKRAGQSAEQRSA